MRLTRHVELAAPVEEVYAAYTDEAFQQETCEATSTGSYTASVTPAGQGASVRTERRLPTDTLPDFAKGFVGPELVLVETTSWDGASADGIRVGTIDLHVVGVPLTLKGTITLTPGASGTLLDLDGDLKANVPLIGRKIESAASDPILAGLDIQLGLLKTRVES